MNTVLNDEHPLLEDPPLPDYVEPEPIKDPEPFPIHTPEPEPIQEPEPL